MYICNYKYKQICYEGSMYVDTIQIKWYHVPSLSPSSNLFDSLHNEQFKYRSQDHLWKLCKSFSTLTLYKHQQTELHPVARSEIWVFIIHCLFGFFFLTFIRLLSVIDYKPSKGAHTLSAPSITFKCQSSAELLGPKRQDNDAESEKV